MVKSPLLSIIFPVYNVEPYVEKSLNSIINQTYKNLEIIVVLGASTDASSFICERMASKDDRIKIVYQNGKGVSDARILGFEEASGDYVGCLDSDDYLELFAYEQIMNKAVENDADCIVFGWTKEFGERSETYLPKIGDGLYDKKLIEKHIMPSILIDKNGYDPIIPYCPWNKIVKAKIVKDNIDMLSPKLRYREDLLSTTAFLLKCNSIFLMQSCVFVHYLFRESSLVNQLKLNLFQSDIELFHCLNRLLVDNPILQNQVKLIFINFITENIFNEFRNKELQKKEQRREVKLILANEIVATILQGVDTSGQPFKLKVKKACLKCKRVTFFKLIYRLLH